MTYFKNDISSGYNICIDAQHDDMGTQMDVGLLVLGKGQSYSFNEDSKEIAVLLLEGEVSFQWGAMTRTAERRDTFQNDAWCLHTCKNTSISITALDHSELYVQMTVNERKFETRLYSPDDVMVQRAGANGELMGCMRRDIKTLFDYESAPYSNMVLGEVLNYPGRWSSYPPHYHPQPEVYFYRFDRQEGFGIGFANDEIYKTQHNGIAVINYGFHSQAAAPGYAMCYVWGIRHLEGDPWKKTRIDDPEHAWLWKADANNHIFGGGQK